MTRKERIVSCQACPRLLEHCRQTAKTKRRAYLDETYWGKPVPDFGSLRARLLVVGLAPAAHGANRTGRMFTGDRSGDWLYRALHASGFANQPHSESLKDGLKLDDACVTAVAHCAPPQNKPTAEEIRHCSVFLRELLDARVLRAKKENQVVLCLGGLAWQQVLRELSLKKQKFGHAVEYSPLSGLLLLASYHPSQQNTFTGRLTRPMLDQVFQRAQEFLTHG